MNTLTNINQNNKPGQSEKKGPSVLVVDDEPLMCWSIENALEKAGARVTTASTGEEAIELIRSSAFDVIITDMKLPRVDGFGVAKAGKGGPIDTQIIMISAYRDEQSRKKAADLGIEQFIDKPFDLGEMVKLVKDLTSKKF